METTGLFYDCGSPGRPMEKDEGRPILGSCADSAMPFSVGFRVEGSSGFRVAFGFEGGGDGVPLRHHQDRTCCKA